MTSEYVNPEDEVQHFLDQFEGLNDEQKEALTNDFSNFVEAWVRWRYLPRSKNFIRSRVLSNGNPVVLDANSVTRDLKNTSVFDTFNYVGGTISVNASNARQVDIQMGGGSDCMFTQLVSRCFATLPGFTEGMTFTSLAGCTFTGWSTVQGAATAVSALGTNVNPVIYICAGTYNENVTFTGPSTNTVSIVGAGRDAVNISGQSAAGTTLKHTTTASTPFRVRDLTITVHPSTAAIGIGDVGGSSQWFVDNVKINTSLVNTVCVFTGPAASAWQFNECQFTGAGIAFADSGPDRTDIAWGNVVCVNCDFNTAVAALFANDSNFWAIGCVFRGATGIKNDSGFTSLAIHLFGNTFINQTASVLCSAGGGFNRMGIVGNRFTECVTAIDMGTVLNAATTCRIEGNSFETSTGTFKAIDDTSGQFSRSVIIGNVFRGYNANNEMIGLDLTDNEIGHNETDSGAILPDTHATFLGGTFSPVSGAGVSFSLMDSVISSSEDSLGMMFPPGGVAGPTGATGAAGATGPQGPIGFGMDGADGEDGLPPATPAVNTTRAIPIVLDGGGSTLTTGVRPSFQIPFACTVKAWGIQGDAAGTCTIDVTTSADSATPSYTSMVGAGTKPNVAGPAVGTVRTVPASWTTTTVTQGQLMQVNLTAVATFKWLTLTLEVTVP